MNDVRIVEPKRQRSLWLTFIDGATRDIDGEWSTGGRVSVLRRANQSIDEPIYRDVVYRDVWRGIDARVTASPDGLKYSFEVAPGGNPRAIHLRYSGADKIELTDAGEIVLDTGGIGIADISGVLEADMVRLDAGGSPLGPTDPITGPGEIALPPAIDSGSSLTLSGAASISTVDAVGSGLISASVGTISISEIAQIVALETQPAGQARVPGGQIVLGRGTTIGRIAPMQHSIVGAGVSVPPEASPRLQ